MQPRGTLPFSRGVRLSLAARPVTEAAPTPARPLRSHRGLAIGVVALCAAPTALGLAGVDLGVPTPTDAALRALATSAAPAEALTAALSGSYLHTLLEWSATAAAAFTALLAFTHFHLRRDVVAPTIGMALLAAGLVDAFHTLAADGLIGAAADVADFVPFTWAVSRTFNAVVPLAALAMLLFARRFETGTRPRRSLWVVAIASMVLGALAVALTTYCAQSTSLPRTTFPGAFVTRPWDLYPLAVYLVSGLIIYPRFRRRVDSHFAFALWLSVLPDVATQLHMSLGSGALFDHHFNAAHGLKIVAYLVPCAGLILDYVETHRVATRAEHLAVAHAAALERSNAELRQMTYVASHDLQEPLRMVVAYTELLEELRADERDESEAQYMRYVREGASRMQDLVDSLLRYTQTGSRELAITPVDAERALDGALANLALRVEERGAVIERGPLPRVSGDATMLTQVFQNLVANAIEFSPGDRPRVSISAARGHDDGWTFAVRDWGVGIAPAFHDKVFALFQRLQHRDAVEGSGVGLAVVKKAVERMGGRVWVESELGEGATFRFTLPAVDASSPEPPLASPSIRLRARLS